MPQALHLTLADHRKNALVNNTADTLEIFLLRRARDLMFELVGDIEMIGNRTLTASRYEGTVIHPRRQRFFNAVLQQRFVNDGQHFFRRTFCCRQESRPITRNGE